MSSAVQPQTIQLTRLDGIDRRRTKPLSTRSNPGDQHARRYVGGFFEEVRVDSEQRVDERPTDHGHRDVARSVGIEVDMPMIFQRAEYVKAARGNTKGEHRQPGFHERAPDSRVAGAFRVVETVGNDRVAAGA